MTGCAAIRIPAYAGVSWRARRVGAGATTDRWRDKKAHGAPRSSGCFCLFFWRVPRRAALARTVRFALISLFSQAVLHRAGFRHDR